MASSGFRPPQLSEDVAWLPAWLQPQNECSLDDQVKDSQTAYTQACKVQDIAFEKDVNLFASEQTGHSNFRLLLSGSDNSPVGMTPTENMLHFHLRLSSNGTSQYTASPVLDALQIERGESRNLLSMHQVPEVSAFPQDMSCPDKMVVNNNISTGLKRSKSKMSARSRSPSVSIKGKSCRKKHQEKFDNKNLINADITDAIELSIAASEALAVSDIVNNGSDSEALKPSAVLEVALRVKEARKQLCPVTIESISNCVSDVIDETDLVQDLDENIMADAYEDVGLSIKPIDTNPEDLCHSSPVPEHICSLSGTLSRVLDTPIPESNYRCNVEVQSIRRRFQEVEFDASSNQRRCEEALEVDTTLEDSPSESVLGARQEKLSGDPLFVVDTLSPEIHSESYLNQSVKTHTKITTNQEMNTEPDNESISHTQESIHSSPKIHKSKNVGAKAETISLAPVTFKSRWLGGWTGQGVDVSGNMDKNTAKRITKFVRRETSFISESLDIVSDENSLVKKGEAAPIIASLQSVAYDGLSSTANGVQFSQDLMSSYNLSMADPLCSVVPCSILSADANLNMDASKSHMDQVQKGLNLALENGLEGSELRARASVNFANGEVDMPKSSGEDSVVRTRRQLTSLKTYSRVRPPWKSDLGRNDYRTGSVQVTGITEFLTFEENINCFKSSGRKEPTSDAELRTESASVKDLGEAHQMLSTTHTNYREHDDEHRSSPLILNYPGRRRLRASKIVLSDDTGAVQLKPASVLRDRENRDEICVLGRSTVAPLPPQSSHAKPCEDQGPVRKRVRFLEADITRFEQRNDQKPGSGYHTRSNTRSGRRVKKANSRPDARAQGNTCVKNCHSRDRKRLIFRGLEFLLTGFSCEKERELEMLVRKHGGFIVSDVPPPPSSGRRQRFRCKFQQLPILLSPKKLQTPKFLYACAVNAFLLNTNWLTDSIVAGSLLPPEKYMILPNQNSVKHQRIGRPVHYAGVTYIFDKLGIMLHGKHSFCTNLGKILKHGGGHVFKTLQWLVQSVKKGKISMGVIVIEDESSASRHLRHCASEQKIPMMPANWIIESLLMRKLVPLKENDPSPSATIGIGMSEEI